MGCGRFKVFCLEPSLKVCDLPSDKLTGISPQGRVKDKVGKALTDHLREKKFEITEL